jgi:hypothetical protein
MKGYSVYEVNVNSKKKKIKILRIRAHYYYHLITNLEFCARTDVPHHFIKA